MRDEYCGGHGHVVSRAEYSGDDGHVVQGGEYSGDGSHVVQTGEYRGSHGRRHVVENYVLSLDWPVFGSATANVLSCPQPRNSCRKL